MDGKTYNMERVLRSNIVNSDYFGQLSKVLDFMELVDEIYNEVDHVEPWMSGNARGPSSAFCLLYRLFTMDLDDNNVKHLIHHRDSPYIRALGFLYIRYVKDAKEFGRWFDPFLRDDEMFAPGPGGKEVTMGAFVRDLILDQYYFETIFPRIPEVTRRALVERIRKLGFSDRAMGCGGAGGSRRAQEDAGGGRRPPSVKAALAVNLGQRAPHVAGARESGRGIDPTRNERERASASERGGDDRHRRGDGKGGRDRDRSRDRGRSRDRDHGRDRDYYDRRDRDRDRDYYGRRDRDRDYDRGRDRSRSRDRGGGYRRSRSRSRSRDRR